MNQAFSLPELVTVIVIIGILAAMGLNQYRSFVAKSRQAEAKLNLKAIGDLQESFKYEKGKYNKLDKSKGVGAFGSTERCGTGTNGEQMKNMLGFRPTNCKKLRYGYWWTKGGTPSNPAKAFAESTKRKSDGKLIYTGCEQTDKWILKTKIKEINQGDTAADIRLNSAIEKCE